MTGSLFPENQRKAFVQEKVPSQAENKRKTCIYFKLILVKPSEHPKIMIDILAIGNTVLFSAFQILQSFFADSVCVSRLEAMFS